MKKHFRTWICTGLGFAFLSSAHAGDEPIEALIRTQMEFMIKEQYTVTHNFLQAELSYAHGRLKAIEAERNAAVRRAKARAEIESNGIALLKKYDALIVARYVDKKGGFVPGLEITPKDVENINDLIKGHASWIPLADRVSAGQARKTITFAIERLDEIVSAHRSPSESNNSELEILRKLTKDEEARTKRTLMLADTLGLKLDPNAPPPPPIQVKAPPPPPAPTPEPAPKNKLKTKSKAKAKKQPANG